MGINFQRGVVIKTSRIIHEKPHPTVECKMRLTKHQQNTSHFFHCHSLPMSPMALFDSQLYIRNITHTHPLVSTPYCNCGYWRQVVRERERERLSERNLEESSKPIDKYTYTFLFRRNFSETNDYAHTLNRER